MEAQRTTDWHKLRGGKITASDVVKIMGVKGLGETGKTYIFEKAVEAVFGVDEDDSFVTFDMKRGIELEPIAFDRFAEQKSMEFLDVQKAYFFPYKDYAGASPDGLVGSDAVLEIKCPRPAKFFRIKAFGIDEIDAVYYAQMQMQMLCTNSQRAHFYNYCIYNGQEYDNEIIVPRDEAYIQKLEQRLTEANELRLQYIELLTNGKIANP